MRNDGILILAESLLSKSLTAICIAMLVEKGLLRYHEKISSHWPEFGQQG